MARLFHTKSMAGGLILGAFVTFYVPLSSAQEQPNEQKSPHIELNLDLSFLYQEMFVTQPDSSANIVTDYMAMHEQYYQDALMPTLEARGKKYPFGLKRFKADKTLRVRGWELTDNLYFGQAKVGKKWGVGLVYDRGSHYYGLNNRGFSFLKKF